MTYSCIIIAVNSIVDPIGGTKPKFSQESESSTFTKKSGQQLSLLCPAQGAPLPSFRLVAMMFEFLVSIFNRINLGCDISNVLISIKVNLFLHSGSKGKRD